MVSYLSVITVTHQSALFIGDQLSSVVSGALRARLEQIVVDNGSTDRTAEIAEGFGSVRVIRNAENRGFAVANNQATQIAQGQYLLFLNPDMRVKEGSLDALVDWMDGHAEVGLLGCRLEDAHGELLSGPRRLPRLFNELL